MPRKVRCTAWPQRGWVRLLLSCVYGKKVYSPLIEPGGADIQVAFEMMEAVRYLPYLHKGSKVVVNTQKNYYLLLLPTGAGGVS